MPYSRTDLDYNRAGQLSPKQRQRSRRGGQRTYWMIGGATCFLLALGLFSYTQGDWLGMFSAWLVAAMLIVVTLRVQWMLFSMRRMVRRIHVEQAVQQVVGAVWHEAAMDDGTLRHFLRVGDLRLSMEASDVTNFVDGQTYRVYYLAGMDTLVSAEDAYLG